MTNRAKVLKWLSKLSAAEFAQIVYEADAEREGWGSRFILAEVGQPEPSSDSRVRPVVIFVAVNRYGEPWSGDEPLSVRGQCSKCGSLLLSQIEKMACPVCGQAPYGS